jgi:hypothetical protein
LVVLWVFPWEISGILEIGQLGNLRRVTISRCQVERPELAVLTFRGEGNDRVQVALGRRELSYQANAEAPPVAFTCSPDSVFPLSTGELEAAGSYFW